MKLTKRKRLATVRTTALDRIKASTQADGCRTSVFHWFLQNHQEFAQILRTRPRPSWKAIVAELQADGITKKDQGPLTPAYVRQAWWRAQHVFARSKVKADAGKPAPHPKAVVVPAPTPPPQSTAPSTGTEHARHEPPPLDTASRRTFVHNPRTQEGESERLLGASLKPGPRK